MERTNRSGQAPQVQSHSVETTQKPKPGRGKVQSLQTVDIPLALGDESRNITVTPPPGISTESPHCFNEAPTSVPKIRSGPRQPIIAQKSGEESKLPSLESKPSVSQSQTSFCCFEGEQIILESSTSQLKGGLVVVQHEGKDVVVHSKIYNHFKESSIPKIAKSQTLIRGKIVDGVDTKLSKVNEISAFLKHSSGFKHLENLEFLAEGGEAVVYKINYIGFDEVVLKVPLVGKELQGFEDLICETQLIKCIYHKDYVVEVKEEIIEIDFEAKKLMRYCVVIERARRSFHDLFSFKMKDQTLEKTGIWHVDSKSNTHSEKFSVQKFLFYFLQTLNAVDYLHQQGIVFADMKPHNLLVMRDQKIKLGDFGVSIVTRPDKDEYCFRGLTSNYAMPAIREAFLEAKSAGAMDSFWAEYYPFDLMKLNDYYGLCLTFSIQTLKLLVPETLLSPQEMHLLDNVAQLMDDLVVTRKVNAQQVAAKIEDQLFGATYHFNKLLTVLKAEKKFQAAYDVCHFVKDKFDSKEAPDDENKGLFLIITYLIMGEFLQKQGSYSNAMLHLQRVEQEIQKYRPLIQSPAIKQDFLTNEIDSINLMVKCYLQQGLLSQAAEKLNLLKLKLEAVPEIAQRYHPQFLEIQGEVYMHSGNYPAALQVYQEYSRVVDERAKEENSDFTEAIHSSLNLGSVFFRLGNLEESLKFYQQAQEYIRRGGNKDSQSIDCLKAIGNIHLKTKNFDQADKVVQQALDISKELFGEYNITTAETYRQIADLYSQLQDDKALFYYQKASNIFECLYGPDSSQQAIIYNNLGGFYQMKGDYASAEEMCLKSVQIKLKFSGEESVDVSNIYQNLGQIMLHQKNFEKASQYIKKGFEIKKKVLGPDKAETLKALVTYGQVLLMGQRIAEAYQLAQVAIEVIKANAQMNAQSGISLLMFIALAQKQSLKLVEATSTLKQVLVLLEKGGDTPQINKIRIEALKDLGDITDQGGNHAEAIKFFSEALKQHPTVQEEILLTQRLAFLQCKTGKQVEGLENLIRTESLISSIQGKIPAAAYNHYEQNLLPAIRDLRGKCESLLNFKKSGTLKSQIQK